MFWQSKKLLDRHHVFSGFGCFPPNSPNLG